MYIHISNLSSVIGGEFKKKSYHQSSVRRAAVFVGNELSDINQSSYLLHQLCVCVGGNMWREREGGGQ